MDGNPTGMSITQALGDLEQVKRQLRQPNVGREALEASISRLEHGLALKSHVSRMHAHTGGHHTA